MTQPLIPITRKRAFIFAAFLVLYEFLTYIANDMIMPGMLYVVKTFDASEAAIPTSLTVYILGGASLQLILGPLSDRFGRRPVMLTGAFLFILFTFMIACTQSIDQFLIVRFFQGMGLCFIAVIGYTTLQEIFEEMDAIRLIALLANTATIAPLLGPLAGATILLFMDWRMIFFCIGFFACIAFSGLYLYMPETVGVKRRDGSINQPMNLKISNIFKSYGKLLINFCFILGSIAEGLLAIPCLIWISISPIMLINEAHLSLIEYGLLQIPVFASLILGNFILRRLTRIWSIRTIILRASLLVFSGLFLSILLMYLFESSWKWIVLGLIPYALGMGISGGPLNRQVLFSTTVSKGTASALMSMIAMIILALGIELGKYIYDSQDNSTLVFAWYCLGAGIVYLIAMAGFLILNRIKRSDNVT